MSFFSNLLGGSTVPTSLSKEESFLGIMLSVVAADGEISDDEISDFVSFACKSKMLRNVEQRVYDNMIEKLFRILRRDGNEKLIDLSVQGLPFQLRESAFAVACDLVFSDGVVEKEEERVLDLLKIKMDISDEFAINVAKVMVTKNSI